MAEMLYYIQLALFSQYPLLVQQLYQQVIDYHLYQEISPKYIGLLMYSDPAVIFPTHSNYIN